MQTTEISRRVFAGMIAGAAVSAAGGWIELFDGHDLQGGSSAGKQAAFQNFELEIEALARPGCDSRVSLQPGFEIQIGNSERQKTGSLFGLRNVYKQLVRDDEWFTDPSRGPRPEPPGGTSTAHSSWTTPTSGACQACLRAGT